MKTMLFCLMACLVVGSALAEAGDKKAWFDMENCGMCVSLTSEPGLMENMSWEGHLISGGMMSVTMVPEKYHAAYNQAKMKMHKAGMAMMEGKQMELCGFCTSMGKLISAGANMESVDTKTGSIMLLTSADTKLVEKIQAHASKSMEEYAALMEQGHDAHEGHNH